jgi:hypothetical protein
VGALVELVANGRRQVRDVPGGRGFAGQSDSRLLFGLGTGVPSLERLEITWPSGRVDVVSGAALAGLVDRYTRVVEGEPVAGAI